MWGGQKWKFGRNVNVERPAPLPPFFTFEKSSFAQPTNLHRIFAQNIGDLLGAKTTFGAVSLREEEIASKFPAQWTRRTEFDLILDFQSRIYFSARLVQV